MIKAPAAGSKMYEAVFISDLHLHPNQPEIMNRFMQFIDWACINTQAVYILGDFFHAWPGDDGLEPWSIRIAERLSWLSQQQIAVYFLPGNRDFLLGKEFATIAGFTLLRESTVIQLATCKILLVHGDRYCTNDKGHQWFRRLTRNRWFIKFFLAVSYSIRAKLVRGVRTHSQNAEKNSTQLDIVIRPMLAHMRKSKVNTVIHGHIHKPARKCYSDNDEFFYQYSLSDWDDSPQILCYDKARGFHFNQLI